MLETYPSEDKMEEITKDSTRHHWKFTEKATKKENPYSSISHDQDNLPLEDSDSHTA